AVGGDLDDEDPRADDVTPTAAKRLDRCPDDLERGLRLLVGVGACGRRPRDLDQLALADRPAVGKAASPLVLRSDPLHAHAIVDRRSAGRGTRPRRKSVRTVWGGRGVGGANRAAGRIGYPTADNPATGLPSAPATDGLRNITGRVDGFGHATIWG